MDNNILHTLLAQRIPPAKFQLMGLDVKWVNESFNTPENRAIVDYVIKNYDALAVECYKNIKLDALARFRWQKERSGITVSGFYVNTDRASQAMLTGAKIFCDLNPGQPLDWKGESGWIQLNKDALLTIAQAVGVHVQKCFTNEKAHSQAISTLTTKEQIDEYDFTIGW